MDEINVLNFKDEAQTESFKLKLFWRRSESSKPFEEGWDIYLSYCNTPETLQALLDTWPKCLRIISGFCFNESDRKRVQETEEQGDDEDIFAKARAVLDNLETGIPSASSNMDFVKLNETLLCIRSYLVNSVDEVLLDDVVQGRFYELCQSILPYMHKEDRIEGPILSMFVDQYENSVKDLSQIRDKREN